MGAVCPADWAELLRAAHPDAQGVGPLLYRAFRSGRWPEAMPDEVRQVLRAHYYNTLANNSLIYAELRRVLDALGAAGIRVIVLKGAALAVAVYEDIGLRPMGDIDLLVRPEQLRAAMRALERCGYGLHKISVHAQYLLESSEAVMVELHWGVLMTRADGSRQEQDWFWENAVPAEEAELEGALVLAPAANLAYLAAHAGHTHANFPGRLIWRVDIARLVEKAGLQAPVETARQPGPAEADAGAVRAQGEESPGRIAEALSLLDRRMRIRLLARILVPPTSYMRARYGPRAGYQLPFIYLARWVGGLWRLLAGRSGA